ncbi:MAG: DNA polymerase I [Bacilli bacterium]|nr:DNA polymerase I [Bacilli bacterium]
MKKIVLIDGNNLMFRSYYATAYTGNLMKNSKGLVTNALYGFANMINKIIEEENPEYMCVAFDVGKSFRHREYIDYKAGRNATPEELKKQLPIARDMLDKMGIFNINVLDYEADDIIGTLSKWADMDPEWDALLITSDHDYLQLITDVVNVKLLKQTGFTKYNPQTFKEEYGIDPIRVVDLKALMGDSSDNIPGVPGIGEKTALKLLQEYGTLDNLYNNIESVKGKLKEKLVLNKELAYFSYKLATICRDTPINNKFEDMKYNGPTSELDDFYRELEFYSLINKHENVKKIEVVNNSKVLEELTDIKLDKQISYYIECDNENYHLASILGMGLFDGENLFFVEANMIPEVMDYIKDAVKYTFDLKKNMCLLKDVEINTIFDLNLAAYLLNKITKDDVSILMNNDGIDIPLYHDIIKNKMDVKSIVTMKAKYISDVHDKYIDDLMSEEMYELYTDIEHPLIKVLAKMELNGIKCDANILSDMASSVKVQIDDLEKDIYELCNQEFNIASPKQLAKVLFEDMGLPHGKKISTSADVLEKIADIHPVIPKILEYRNVTKLYNTYLEGLHKYIMEDGKIHTIYKQTLTRTGRLSSVEPNMQNIPARDELGRLVRKAFLPCNQEFLSCDYSQIELRILAHISESEDLIQAFIHGDDIHTKVAADIFNKDMSEVTKTERRTAKAVIFGIVYGISGFGLGENIGVTPKKAKEFIEKYYELYPGVKRYMDMIIKDAYDCGYVRTLFKRKRNIDELFSSNFMVRQGGERIALNTPIQGTSADIIKKAMVEIDKAFEANNIKSTMLLQVHDELIFDCLEEEKEKLVDIVRTIMESTVKLSVPLKVSHDFGTDLYETK